MTRGDTPGARQVRSSQNRGQAAAHPPGGRRRGTVKRGRDWGAFFHPYLGAQNDPGTGDRRNCGPGVLREAHGEVEPQGRDAFEAKCPLGGPVLVRGGGTKGPR